jgi:hypothetical protein
MAELQQRMTMRGRKRAAADHQDHDEKPRKPNIL